MAFANLKTDKDLEINGVEFDYGDGCKALIARSGGANKDYTTALQKMYKSHKHQFETDTMSDEVAERKQREIFSECVLLKLVGAKLEDGSEVTDRSQYSEWLKENPNVYADFTREAAKLSNFLLKAREQDEKN